MYNTVCMLHQTSPTRMSNMAERVKEMHRMKMHTHSLTADGVYRTAEIHRYTGK